MTIEGFDEADVAVPTHPNNAELGDRIIDVSSGVVYVERSDLVNKSLRLKEFGDFEISGTTATFVSKERTDKRKIIHWVSQSTSDDGTLIQVLNDEICHINGRLESHSLSLNTPVQLERIGYGVISADNKVVFTHD